MLLTKEVYINQWTNYIIKLETLGYELPKHIGKQGIEVYATRQPLLVKVEHLFPNSCALVEYQCTSCGGIFELMYNRYTKNKSKLCFTCAKQAKKGIPHSREWVDKISKANKGNKRSPEQCAAMSMRFKLRGWVGNKHPRYDPTLTDEYRGQKRLYTEYREWRQKVFEDSNFSCVVCGKYNGYLNAHHIMNYSSNVDLRLELTNGVTMCKECHKLFHSTYGRKNNNIYQLNQFISKEHILW